MARINLLDREQAPPAFGAIYERSEEQGRPVLNIVRLLAHCPEMGSEYFRFAGSVLRGESVPMRLRELATLRVGKLNGADYAFEHHIPLGLRGGLTRGQIDAVGSWEASGLFGDDERLVLRFADEMARDNDVSDETFALLRERFSEHDILELALVVGYFLMLCRILAAFRVENEPGFTVPSS